MYKNVCADDIYQKRRKVRNQSFFYVFDKLLKTRGPQPDRVLWAGEFEVEELGAEIDDRPQHPVIPHLGAAQVHDTARLPREFAGLPNGHAGSHQFLVNDFVKACHSGEALPNSNNAWDAARYVLPGLAAHESALQDGALLPVLDLGDPPTRN